MNIVYVSVNKNHVTGNDPILAAWSSWQLGGLLNHQNFRNGTKYLGAKFQGDIIAVFCIKGVAVHVAEDNGPVRVKFALEQVVGATHDLVKQQLTNGGVLQKPRSCGYVRKVDNIPCSCMEEIIPVVDEANIIDGVLQN